MQGPKTDPKAEKDMLPILKRDERLIWASRRSRPGRMTRYATYVWSAACVGLTTAAIAYGAAATLILIGIFFLPNIYSMLTMWFVTYGITDKRFYIVCRLPPRSWESLNLVDWDTNWIRFGVGKNRIHLAFYGPRKYPGWWSKSRYRRHSGNIENIPDLESVRELLLQQIGSATRPDDETKTKEKPRKPVIPGTMTG